VIWWGDNVPTQGCDFGKQVKKGWETLSYTTKITQIGNNQYMTFVNSAMVTDYQLPHITAAKARTHTTCENNNNVNIPQC